MFFKKFKNMSRLKKKLMIYFILIAIVSVSVSAEMILEISSQKFQNSVIEKFYEQLSIHFSKSVVETVKKDVNPDEVYSPITNLRNRMILFLLVISGSIGMAFLLFAKDIVYPMDCMVDATKKITRGDLTVHVPVMSTDEIGQIAGLINDMNINLQDVLMRIQQDVEQHLKEAKEIEAFIEHSLNLEKDKKIISSKKMHKSDFVKIIDSQHNIQSVINKMNKELNSLIKFLDMFNTYSIPDEITQEEIEATLEHYNR